MKKIIFWIIIVILIILTARFSYCWYGAMEMVFTQESIKAREIYCQRQKDCDDCKRDFNCILKKCEQETPQTYIDGLIPGYTLEKWIKSQCSEHPDIQQGQPTAFMTGWCGDNLLDIDSVCEQKTKVQVLFEWHTIKTALEWMSPFGGPQ